MRTSDPTPSRGASRLAAIAALAAAALCGGCNVLPRNANPEADSVFELFTPPSPAEAASWAADPFDADKRQRGVLLLANAPFGGERPYVQLYEMRLQDEDPAVRLVATRALALHGTSESVPSVIEGLSDSNVGVRRESARALQRLHNPVAVEPLIEAMDYTRESDPDTRANAARALGQYAEPRVVQALIGALADRRLAVNRNALESLRVLTGEDFGLISRQWLAWTGQSRDLFAGRGDYEYPVFRRDQTIVEFLLPWWDAPNETPGAPAGMIVVTPREIEEDLGAEQEGS